MTLVTTLESAGCDVGEFWAFGVSGNTMVFIESGRLWTLDIAANQATWLQNDYQVSGNAPVDFRSDGVMFTTDDALMYFDYAKNELIDVRARIDENPYKLNETFASASNWYTDYARYKNYVVYIGQSGVFAYDMVGDTITPVLLSPHSSEIRIDYRYPVVLDSGKLFVVGLTSTSGATGAEGPNYMVDFASLLP
jgi:hypothetical protein